MLHSNLTHQVAHTTGHWPRKYLLAMLRYPYQVHFKIVLRVRAYSIPFTRPYYTNFLFASRRGVSTIPEGDTNYCDAANTAHAEVS